MERNKIILFGGTFDPIHAGHTKVAAHACDYLGAERVVFIPAKRSPLKGFLPRAGDSKRFEMIALAIADNPKFEVNDLELNKPAPSYTIDTIRTFQSRYAPTELYWLVGADGVKDLQYWHKIADLLDACNICTMYRAGYDQPDFGQYEAIWGRARIEKLRRNVVATPLVDVSSTTVRECIAAGKDVSHMLHPSVAQYIREHGLYV